VVESSYITFNENTFNIEELVEENGPILDIKELLRSSSTALALEGASVRKLTNFNRGRLLKDYKDNISPDPEH